MVGQFALGLAITAPLVMLCNLSLRHVQATDTRKEFSFGNYLSLRLYSTLLFLALLIVILFFSRYPYSTAAIVAGIGLAKALESISDLFFGLMQQQERMDLIARSMIFKGPLSLFMIGTGLFYTGDIRWGVLGLIVSHALLLVFYDIPNGVLLVGGGGRMHWKTIRPMGSPILLGKIAWLALPLSAAQMLISLNANVPRYFVEKFSGEYLLGIFAAQASLLLAGNQIVNALGQSCIPRLSYYYASNQRFAYKRLLVQLCGVGLALGLLGWIAAILMGRFFLTVLFSADYSNHVEVLQWIMLGSAASFVGSFLGYGITATRQFSSFLIPYLALLVFIISVSWLLIPRWGIVGAAWVQGLSGIGYCLVPLFIFATIRRKNT